MNLPINDWTILIVEDDPDGQAITKEILEAYGIKVDVVKFAQHALEKLAEHTYTAIIIDLALPDMSGFELLKRLDPQIPCIAITAFHSSKVAQEAINAGFVGYIPKPIKVNSFFEEVIQLLR
jgi:CheY-like chemotaxis protein